MSKSDEAECQKLHLDSYGYPGPTLSDPRYVGKGVAESDDTIIGFGNLSVLVEAGISLHKLCTKREKAHAIEELFKLAIFDAKKLGIDEIVTFVTEGGPLYVAALKNRFGFKEIEGHPLRLRI